MAGLVSFVLEPLASYGGTSDLINPQKWVGNVLGMRRVASGALVSPSSAMNVETYSTCIRTVAEDLGYPEWRVDLVEFGGSGERRTPQPDHDVARLLARPNPYMNGDQFRELLTQWALGWGKGRAEIERDPAGKPVALWPIPPSAEFTWQDPATGIPYVWVMPFPGFEGGLLPLEDVFNIHGPGPSPYEGWSIAQGCATTIGNLMAAEEFEGRLFASGSVSRIALKYPKKLDDMAQLKRMRRQWIEQYGGDGVGLPLILEGGMEAQTLSFNPRDSQFIESVKGGEFRICRMFRTPPPIVGLAVGDVTVANFEQLVIQYRQGAIVPWARRFNVEADQKLFSDADERRGLRCCINLDALLVADVQRRSEALQKEVFSGQRTPNEARARLGLNPHANPLADELWMQGATVPFSMVRPPAPAKPPGGGDAPASPPPSSPPAKDAAEGDTSAGYSAWSAAASACSPAIRDVGVRFARRTSAALDKAATRFASSLAGAPAWAHEHFTAERTLLVTLVVPQMRAIAGVAAALGSKHAGDLDTEYVAGAFADAYVESAAKGAVEHLEQRRRLDVDAAAAAIEAGILATLERARLSERAWMKTKGAA